MKMNQKWILIILAVIAIIGIGAFVFLKNKEPEVTYQRITVEKDNLIQRIQATGIVSPQNRLEIKPPVPGRIDQILVKEGDEVKKGKVLAWVSSNERAALLDSVRTQGDKEIKKWEDLYKPTPVIAPINGTIILRNVESGQSFANTDPIFVMADRLTIKAQVDETDIAFIKINQPAEIILDAYPDSPLKGKVVHLAYDATLTNNVTTYEVDILPIDPPDFIRSGMTSNVNVEVSRKEDVILIPIAALISQGEETTVRIENGTKSSVIPVKTGKDDGKFVEILDGLSVGDVVLVKETGKSGKKSTSGSPLFPGGRGGRGGRR